MEITPFDVFIGALIAYLFYRLSITDPHHWRTFPRFAGDVPNKVTALVVAVGLGVFILLLEGLV